MSIKRSQVVVHLMGRCEAPAYVVDVQLEAFAVEVNPHRGVGELAGDGEVEGRGHCRCLCSTTYFRQGCI